MVGGTGDPLRICPQMAQISADEFGKIDLGLGATHFYIPSAYICVICGQKRICWETHG
jgi:hypothetical protein